MKFIFIILNLILIISFPLYSQETALTKKYHFASIEYLMEQEVGRIVLSKIYQNLGVNITIAPLPGERAQFEANSGMKDGEIMRIFTYGDDNPKSIRVPTPYYFLETMVFTLKGSNIEIRDKNDLKKYRIAKVRGVKHTNNITAGLTNVYDMNSTESMLKMLKKGKVDVALTNTFDGNLAIKRLGYKNITSITKPLAVLPLYHYIYEDNKALVPLINDEILKLKKNGELKKLIVSAEQEVTKRTN